jgi:hypothetical protein
VGGRDAAHVAPRSRRALHGSTPDVSVAGYALGGGVGWYARKHGLAANSVTAIELVTADGRLRRVDHDHGADLFWALRGGGGNLGVVTTIELELHPISEVYAGMLFFPWERSSEVLHTWLDWTATLPDEVTSVGRIVQLPPVPHLPAELRGRRLGRELIEPLRRLGPAVDTFAMRPPAGIADLHREPRQPVPAATDSVMLADLPTEAIDRFVAATGPGSGSRLIVADLRHLGGALGRSQPHHGALATLDASFVSFGVGMAGDDAARDASHERLALLSDALAPYDTGRRYLNFADRPTDPARFWPPDVYLRLRAIKASVDPDGLFRANHAIPTTG